MNDKSFSKYFIYLNIYLNIIIKNKFFLIINLSFQESNEEQFPHQFDIKPEQSKIFYMIYDDIHHY